MQPHWREEIVELKKNIASIFYMSFQQYILFKHRKIKIQNNFSYIRKQVRDIFPTPLFDNIIFWFWWNWDKMGNYYLIWIKVIIIQFFPANISEMQRALRQHNSVVENSSSGVNWSSNFSPTTVHCVNLNTHLPPLSFNVLRSSE